MKTGLILQVLFVCILSINCQAQNLDNKVLMTVAGREVEAAKPARIGANAAGVDADRLEERIQSITQEIEDIKNVYKRVKIEQYNDTFYLFNADTDEFIGQGRTMQEIADKVKGEVILNVMEGDPDVIQRFKQTFPQTDLA